MFFLQMYLNRKKRRVGKQRFLFIGAKTILFKKESAAKR